MSKPGPVTQAMRWWAAMCYSSLFDRDNPDEYEQWQAATVFAAEINTRQKIDTWWPDDHTDTRRRRVKMWGDGSKLYIPEDYAYADHRHLGQRILLQTFPAEP